jgi:hypothetical protein
MHLVLMLIRLRCIVSARTGRETLGLFAGPAFCSLIGKALALSSWIFPDWRSTMSPDEAPRIPAGVEWRGPSCNPGAGESDPDAELVALGRRFEALSAELEALQKEADKLSDLAQRGERLKDEAMISSSIERIEAVLRLLDPIERAIIAKPAITVAGLGVKARHAAHVLSHYWTGSAERLDWDERTVRLLIESTCTVAGIGLLPSQQRDSKYDEAALPR